MGNQKRSFKKGHNSSFQSNQDSTAPSSDKLVEFLKHAVGNLGEAYLLNLAELAALKETKLKTQLAQVQDNEKLLKKELEKAKKTIEVYKPQVALLSELQRGERELKKELQQARKTIQDYKDKAEKTASPVSKSSINNQVSVTTPSSSEKNEFFHFAKLLKQLEQFQRRNQE